MRFDYLIKAVSLAAKKHNLDTLDLCIIGNAVREDRVSATSILEGIPYAHNRTLRRRLEEMIKSKHLVAVRDETDKRVVWIQVGPRTKQLLNSIEAI